MNQVYYSEMYEEHETRCLDSNIRLIRDIPAILFFCGFYILLRRISKNVAHKILYSMSIPNIEKKRLSQKFFGSFYRLQIYLIFSLYGIFTLRKEKWLFSPFEYTLTWINNQTPKKIFVYYYIELSHYFASIFFLFSEPRMSDFYQMLIHHFVTIILIILSFHTNLLRYGVLIMILHDLSDPIMESAKLFFYSKQQKIADILFCSFAGIFIGLRCVFYPFFVICPAIYYGWIYGINIQFAIQLGSLVLLQILNGIWAAFIVRMIINFCSNGKLKGDIRTNDETSIKDA